MNVLLDKRLQDLVGKYLPEENTLQDLACLFSVFSDVTRLKIISALSITEMCVSDISNLLRINQTTVSHQLRLLKNLNVVRSKRQGKIVFYYLTGEKLSEIMLNGVEFLGY